MHLRLSSPDPGRGAARYANCARTLFSALPAPAEGTRFHKRCCISGQRGCWATERWSKSSWSLCLCLLSSLPPAYRLNDVCISQARMCDPLKSHQAFVVSRAGPGVFLWVHACSLMCLGAHCYWSPLSSCFPWHLNKFPGLLPEFK